MDTNNDVDQELSQRWKSGDVDKAVSSRDGTVIPYTFVVAPYKPVRYGPPVRKRKYEILAQAIGKLGDNEELHIMVGSKEIARALSISLRSKTYRSAFTSKLISLRSKTNPDGTVTVFIAKRRPEHYLAKHLRHPIDEINPVDEITREVTQMDIDGMPALENEDAEQETT